LTDLLDLTPRPQAPRPPLHRRIRNLVLLGVVVAALGFVLVRALTDARVFFYNVDEAVQKQHDLGDKTFRMHGVVVSELARDHQGVYRFRVSHGDVEAVVHHVGAEPTDLFEIGVPVVVQGRWDGSQFRSQQILVRHSEEYIAENPTRVGPYGYDTTGSR
jgi:cytochrome c-type biogenesis protein CcmE